MTSYTSGNRNPKKTFYIFSKESFSYISRNGNLEKIPYILGNGTFLIFQEVTFRALKIKKTPLLKSFLYFRR